MIDLPIDSSDIVITASRAPQETADTSASVTIFDASRLDRLDEPLVPALLRLVPSTAVASLGGAGTLTEVRIRGAEANHTLLFVDGIRVNDPASGNVPRFELLNADIASRIEVVRGPQSALWGSEAIGGVIAVNGAHAQTPALGALMEAGSFGFRRASAQASIGNDGGHLSLAGGWQRSDGIDIYGGGDRDGYRNLSGRISGRARLGPSVELGGSALALTGWSELDGFDPHTGQRSHAVEADNELAAGRVWARAGDDVSPWNIELSASALGSGNVNLFAGDEINRTEGRRTTLAAQGEYRFRSGAVRHRLIAALEHETEQFEAHDTVYSGGTNQQRSRAHQSVTLEWNGGLGAVSASAAVRHDAFNRFKDATNVRAGLVADVGKGASLAASYAEGIAQPTFFDLYGYFPGSFVGNPELKPESSRGFEVSARLRRSRFSAALTAYRQRLHAEIVDVFDTFPFTTRNREEASRRSGVEAEVAWAPSAQFRLTGNYAFLDAEEVASGGVTREVRRPRHSGSITADGQFGRISYAAAVAYTGTRYDNRDIPPYDRVRLGSYWLASARLAYAITPSVQAFARVSNALDQRYEDVVGYRTEGRAVHVGIRIARRR